MKKNLKKKAKIIEDINKLANNSILTAVINYSNIKSLEIKYIRCALNKNNIITKVIKNTLAKKAFYNTTSKELNKNITGKIITIFSKNEVSTPIKILNNFKDKYNNFKIKSICIHGKLFSEKNINELIKLPNKKQGIQKINMYIKIPIFNIIKNFKYPYIKLFILFKLISKK